MDGEEPKVSAQLPMVALGRLFQPVQVQVQGVLRFEGGAVDALEHGSVFVAAPIGPGNAQQLERGHSTSGLDVGAVAEIGEWAVGVDTQGVVLNGVDDLQLERLVSEHVPGLGAGYLGALKGEICGDGLGHLLLDHGEVVVGEGAGELEVVVEAVLGWGPDGELGLGEDGAHGLGHDMGGGVPDALAAQG